MPDSLKISRLCFIVAGLLEIATAALLLSILIAGAALVGLRTERAGLLGSALLGATGVALIFLFAACGVVNLAIASGVAKGRPWSRVAGTAMAVLLLVAAPVGTVLGIFALQGLRGPDARAWFGLPGGPPPSSNLPLPPF